MVPFDISVLQSVYPGCKQITDKARRLVAEGRIIRLKKDLYVACANGGELSRELVANHLYGPSYVSMSSKLVWADSGAREPHTINNDKEFPRLQQRFRNLSLSALCG